MKSSTFIKENMLIDPPMQKEIIRRAVDANLGDNPNKAVHFLGTLEMPDGKEVAVHLRHAADAVLWDDFGHVVLITRKHNPGAGLKDYRAVLRTRFRESAGQSLLKRLQLQRFVKRRKRRE